MRNDFEAEWNETDKILEKRYPLESGQSYMFEPNLGKVLEPARFDLNAYLRSDANLKPEFAAVIRRGMADGSYWRNAWAGRLAPRQVNEIRCADGLTLSVQASKTHYCVPAPGGIGKHFGPWTHVEVGYTSQSVPELLEYADNPDTPTDTVYGCVPVTLVEEVIQKHGGVVFD